MTVTFLSHFPPLSQSPFYSPDWKNTFVLHPIQRLEVNLQTHSETTFVRRPETPLLGVKTAATVFMIFNQNMESWQSLSLNTVSFSQSEKPNPLRARFQNGEKKSGELIVYNLTFWQFPLFQLRTYLVSYFPLKQQYFYRVKFIQFPMRSIRGIFHWCWRWKRIYLLHTGEKSSLLFKSVCKK